MRKEKEYFNSAKSRSATVWRPDIPTHVKPVIQSEVIQEGVRMYKDAKGKLHVADIFDKIFGTGAFAPILTRNRSLKPAR